MCLIISKRFIAKKPIFCYKIGSTIDFWNSSMFRSPIVCWIMSFNKLYFDPIYNEFRNKRYQKTDEVYSGFIHACKTYSKALKIYNELSNNRNHNEKYFIFRAIIPVGSVGFYGECNDICSNQIIILNPNLPGYEELCTEYGLDPFSNKFP